MRQTGNTMLVTGGTSGIGEALARRFHAAGNRVIIAGRRKGRLDAIAAELPGIDTVELDIADPGSIAAAAERVLERHPALDVLVNNAGIMIYEDLARARDLAAAEAMVATNLLGPIRMTDALVDHLAARPGAAIINVTSGLAFVPLVHTPTYSATKAALHSYTQSLRVRLAGKVEVIELVPPGVQTDLTPGQATREGYMPLERFIDEVMDLFGRDPTPAEITVEAVGFLRRAEAEGRMDATIATLDAAARARA